MIAACDATDLESGATATRKLGEIHSKLGKYADSPRTAAARDYVAAESKAIRIKNVEAVQGKGI